MNNYDHLECSVDITVRIAQASCTQYAPTTQIMALYDGIIVSKSGIFTYGDMVDISVPCTCYNEDDTVDIRNGITDGFAVDLVIINADGNQYIYDASTYSTAELDVHLKNDECWYFDMDGNHWRWMTSLKFHLD